MTFDTIATVPEQSKTIPVELFWVKHLNNFRGKLSPLIVEQVSGRPVRHSSRSPKLYAIGSTINVAKDGDVIWGSGLWFPCSVSSKPNIKAVRGPLTRKYLLEQKIDCHTVFGDPAILLPLFCTPSLRKKQSIHHATL